MKITKLLLVLVIAVSLLVGCGTYYGITGGKVVDAVLVDVPEVEGE